MELRCPECGSTRLVKAGVRKTLEKPDGVQQYRCNKCLHYTIHPVSGHHKKAK